MKIAKQRGGHTALDAARWAAGHYSDERDWTERDERQPKNDHRPSTNEPRQEQKGGRDEH